MNTRVILGMDLEDGMTLVGFMDKTATISRVHKGSQFVYYRNNALGINDRVGLYDELTIVVPNEEETMFLVCRGCGESFDSITPAREHGTFIPGPDPSWCGDAGFDIVPESEAF